MIIVGIFLFQPHPPFKDVLPFPLHDISTKSAEVKFHVSEAFSLPLSASPSRLPPPPSFMCPKHIPSSHFIPPLHPSHVLKFISPYLSPLVSPRPSLHLAYLAAALLAQWQSHHTLSISLVRPGRSAAQRRAALVWSHQCQSVSLTLSVTLKRFRLPDIVCFPLPPHCRSGDGRDGAGVEIQLTAQFDITWHTLWPVSALKVDKSSFKNQVRSSECVKKTVCVTSKLVQNRSDCSARRRLSYLPQASSCGWRLRKENCRTEKDREEKMGMNIFIRLPLLCIDHKQGMFWQRRIKPHWCVLYRICNKCCLVLISWFTRRHYVESGRSPNSLERTENCREWLHRSYRLALWIIMKTSVITFSFK